MCEDWIDVPAFVAKTKTRKNPGKRELRFFFITPKSVSRWISKVYAAIGLQFGYIQIFVTMNGQIGINKQTSLLVGSNLCLGGSLHQCERHITCIPALHNYPQCATKPDMPPAIKFEYFRNSLEASMKFIKCQLIEAELKLSDKTALLVLILITCAKIIIWI